MPGRTRVASASKPVAATSATASSSSQRAKKPARPPPPSHADDQAETSRRERVAPSRTLRPTNSSKTSTKPPVQTEQETLAQLRSVDENLSRSTVAALQHHLRNSSDACSLARKAVSAVLVSYRALNAQGWKADGQDEASTGRAAALVEATSMAIRAVAKGGVGVTEGDPVGDVLRAFRGRIAIGMHKGFIKDLRAVRDYLITGTHGEHDASSQDELDIVVDLLEWSHDSPSSATIQVVGEIQFSALSVLADHRIRPPISLNTLAACDRITKSIKRPHNGCLAWAELAASHSDPQMQRTAMRIFMHAERSLGRLSTDLSQAKDVLTPNDEETRLHWKRTLFAARIAAVVVMLKQSIHAGNDDKASKAEPIFDRISRVIIAHWKDCEGVASEQARAFLDIHAALKDEIEPLVHQLQWTTRPVWIDAVLKKWKTLAVRTGDWDAVRHVGALLGEESSSSGATRKQSAIVAPTMSSPPLVASCQAADDLLLTQYNGLKVRTKGKLGALEEDRILQDALTSMQTHVAIEAQSLPPTLYDTLDNIARICASFVGGWSQIKDERKRKLRLDFYRAVLQCLSIHAGQEEDEVAFLAQFKAVLRGSTLLASTLTGILQESSQSRLDPLHIMQDCASLLDKNRSRMPNTDTLYDLYVQISEYIWTDGIRSYQQKSFSTALEIVKGAAEVSGKVPHTFDASSTLQRKKTWEKWTVVATCCAQVNQPRQSLEAYAKAIATVPSQVWQGLSGAAGSKTSIDDVFATNDRIRMLLIRTAQLSIMDLLIDQSRDGNHPLSILAILDNSDAAIPHEARALCLELLYTSPAVRVSMHLDYACKAVDAFLAVCVAVTDGHETPVRKARRLLAGLEADVLSGRGCQRERREEIEAILKQAVATPHEDAGLVGDVQRLSVELHLWSILALQDGVANRSTPADLARAASDALQPFAVDVAASPETPEKQPLKPKSVNVTPPRKTAGRTAVTAASKKASAVKAAVSTIEDPSSAKLVCSRTVSKPLGTTARLLELVCDYLASTGHTFPAIELLRRLRSVVSSDSDMYARANVQLAMQYLSIGQASKAESLLAPLLESKSYSSESRYPALITHVQVLCALGRAPQASTSYEEAVSIAESLHTELKQSCHRGASKMTLAMGKIAHHSRSSQAALAFSQLALAGGDLVHSIKAAYCCMWDATCAAEGVTKVVGFSGGNEESSSNADDGDVFDAPEPSASSSSQTAIDIKMQALVISEPPQRSVAAKPPLKLSSHTLASLHWRSVQAHVTAQLHLASLLEVQGSATDALAQLVVAESFTERLGLDLLLSRVLLQKASLLFKMHQDDEAKADVERVKGMLQGSEVDCAEAVLLRAVRAQYLASRPQVELKMRALQVYETALEGVEELSKAVSDVEEKTTVAQQPVAKAATVKATTTTRTARNSRTTSRQPATTRTKTVAASTSRAAKSTSAVAKRNVQADQISSLKPMALTPTERPSMVLPDLMVIVLSAKTILLHALDQTAEAQEILTQLLALSSSPAPIARLTQADISLRTALHDVPSDPLWGLVSMAVLSLPIGATSTGLLRTLSTCAKNVKAELTTAEISFKEVAGANCTPATTLRRALMGLGSAGILQSMAMPASRSKNGTASLVSSCLASLDGAASVTLQRQFEQAIWSKFEEYPQPRITWEVSRFLRLSPSKGLQARQSASRAGPVKKLEVGRVAAGRGARGRSQSPVSVSDSDSSDDEEEHEDDVMSGDAASVYESFWKAKRQAGIRAHDETLVNKPLPGKWTVVTLTLSPDRSTLLVSRQSGQSSTPSRIFSLPIDRQAEPDDDEEGRLTMDWAQAELHDIVESSNELSSNAIGIQDKELREWWDNRYALDGRLRKLCENIESKWLGVFKGLLSCSGNVDRLMSSGAMKVFKKNVQLMLQKACHAGISSPRRGSRSSSTPTSSAASSPSAASANVKIDDGLYEMMANLHKMSVTNEELEDLLGYLVELYQFNGVPVALDEVEADHFVVDMQGALEELRGALQSEGLADDDADDGTHLFLVLDKDTCSFPWESIPCLRGKAVCRIPSLSFLHDRVDLARRLGASQSSDGAFHLPTNPSAFYLVNPTGDLHKTQDRFTSYLTHARTPRWTGILGRPPVADEFLSALSRDDIVMYFGHGGGSHYARPNRIRTLQKCAVTMLWGCSSAYLSSQGDFDPTGTPYTYMCAGSPCLIGQLFDATDKELDSVAESVLIKAGLKEGSSASETLMNARKASLNRKVGLVDQGVLAPKYKMSLAKAVAQSRDSCRLPYLTGAASVVWGVPVYFDR